MSKTLRPHQTKALDMLRDSLRAGRKRPMLQAPTGFGKTLIASTIANGAYAKGNQAIFCVPALSLINQTVDRFRDEGLVANFDPENPRGSIEGNDIGVIQAQHELTNPDAPIQIASVQTLMRRQIPEAGVVMIDEAHRWFEFYGKWMSDPAWKGVPFIGLSATPWTRGLGRHYDDLLIPITIGELIEQKYLSPFRVFAPSHPDLSAVRTVAGDYHEGDLSDVMSAKNLVADVVENWCRHGEGRPTLCFAVDRSHAKKLQMEFSEAGVPTDYVDAFTGSKERKEIEDRFYSGETKVVVNVGVLTTGVDWDVRCIILARPTKSEMLYVQIIGRGLRTADDHPVYGRKDDCLIFDHSDTTLRLGFVTDIHHSELSKGEKGKAKKPEKKEALAKECGKCGYLKPPKVHQCPACGFKPERQSGVECEAGELEEITPGRKEGLPSQERKLEVYGQLKRHATLKGYAQGWVYHKYKEYFGFYPHHSMNDAPERPVSPEIASWLKSRQIAWAKSRKRTDERNDKRAA